LSTTSTIDSITLWNILFLRTPPGLYGTPTETGILLNGKKIPALLDTGSTVSTISESYYSKHRATTIPLKSLDNILDIECAGGTPQPYKGYIEANIVYGRSSVK
jgi:hypothetical protein